MFSVLRAEGLETSDPVKEVTFKRCKCKALPQGPSSVWHIECVRDCVCVCACQIVCCCLSYKSLLLQFLAFASLCYRFLTVRHAEDHCGVDCVAIRLSFAHVLLGCDIQDQVEELPGLQCYALKSWRLAPFMDVTDMMHKLKAQS